MKKLSEILCQKEVGCWPTFPVKGMNGYGGEQDGTRVLFALFRCKSRKEAEKILVPENSAIQWARYTSHGWEGSVGVWSDEVSEEELQITPLFFE